MHSIKCSFIGLGKMGRELCARIGGAGFHTFAYDISQEASKFAEENYENVTYSELASAVKNSDIVFSCLPNSNDVRLIVDTLLKQKGTLINVQY
jgi:3-hydroxyisobutyrate dehydrogenase